MRTQVWSKWTRWQGDEGDEGDEGVRTTSDAEDESTLVAIGSGASCGADDSWDAGRVMGTVKGSEESVLVDSGGDGGGKESASIIWSASYEIRRASCGR